MAAENPKNNQTFTRSILNTYSKTVHKTVEEHECNLGMALSTKAAVGKHKKNIHLIKDKVKCEKCEFATQIPHELKRHVLAVHEKVKRYMCVQCNYATSWPSHM